ncbi:MAG: RnfABCDGE type electron transport complex subunit D [Anaerovoracaceae bacterium]
MEKQYYDNLTVSAAPHLVSKISTQKIMSLVLIALVPAFGVGIYNFGYRVITLTLVCIIASVAFEWLFNKALKRSQTVSDCSAVLTGVLLAFNLPSNFPYWMAVIGCFVAIIIVKQLFGGIGQNIVNPAVTARIVLFISFSTEMSTWPLARGAAAGTDAVTGPTPLGIAALGGGELPSNMSMFVGTIGGCIGEVSALALLVGGIFLIWTRVISPIIPICFLGTMVIISLAAGVDPIFHLCAGGAMLGAFFCATDYVTSPLLPKGKIIFGIGCGIFTMIIRLWGSYPEGVSFAILLMNILTPHIDNFCTKHLYKGGSDNEK